MITEAFIKGRFDYGLGKSAVVIVQEGVIVEQKAWAVRQSFVYCDVNVTLNQYNCEIMAAIWACMWCKAHDVKALNIYANTMSCQKWYYRKKFPSDKELGKIYVEESKDLDIFAEYIPKIGDNEFNNLVNDIALKVK